MYLSFYLHTIYSSTVLLYPNFILVTEETDGYPIRPASRRRGSGAAHDEGYEDPGEQDYRPQLILPTRHLGDGCDSNQDQGLN